MRATSGSANGATKNISEEMKVGGVEKDNGTEMQKIIMKEKDEDEEEMCEDEKIPPDGGWGWMVALGLILVFVRKFM